MITALRIFFAIVLVTMVGVSIWASNHTAVWNIAAEVKGDPWFIGCLVDAYLGFLVFYCWVLYRETSNVGRIGWLIALLLLGNIATALYMLIKLFRLPRNATARDLLLRPA